MSMLAKARLYLTADRQALVMEGDADAAYLYVAPGDEIPDSAAARFGLIDGDLPDQGGKERRDGEDKERRGGQDKERRDGQDKRGDALTSTIRGIGPATAKLLAGAGIANVAALAAIDPAAPPTVAGGLPPAFDWAEVVAVAKAAIEPAPVAGA